jgi:hypothetical protein
VLAAPQVPTLHLRLRLRLRLHLHLHLYIASTIVS